VQRLIGHTFRNFDDFEKARARPGNDIASPDNRFNIALVPRKFNRLRMRIWAPKKADGRFEADHLPIEINKNTRELIQRLRIGVDRARDNTASVRVLSDRLRVSSLPNTDIPINRCRKQEIVSAVEGESTHTHRETWLKLVLGNRLFLGINENSTLESPNGELPGGRCEARDARDARRVTEFQVNARDPQAGLFELLGFWIVIHRIHDFLTRR
jgi:hypothetical protein